MLSLSENNRTQKRALIDRKGRGRVYLDYRSTAVDPRGDSGAYFIYVILTEPFCIIPTERSDEGSPASWQRMAMRSLGYARDDTRMARDGRLLLCKAVIRLRAIY